MRAVRSLYEILQVDPRAEPEVVEAAYRRLARKYHPDVASGDAGGERMKQINAAYEVLRDPLRRAAHDRELSRPAEEPRVEPPWRPEPAPGGWEAAPGPGPAPGGWGAAAPHQSMLACRE